MSELENNFKSKLSVNGFLSHVFNFDNDNKANMFNMIQYILIGIIPVTLTLKGIKNFIPEEDEVKSSPEIAIEVSIQLFSIFFAIWFIDKIIRYIPTYSGVDYHKFNEINFILPILVILITMQTKLGAKINILINRVMDLWNGNQDTKQVNNNNTNGIRVSQPIVSPGIHQNSRADTLDNTLIQPPLQQLPGQNNVSMIDALPNIVNSGGQENQGLTSFQNQAIQNSFMETMEPMAANGALGGAFGSSF
tara:strand:+ start:2936 stop:3682 length:747 start_codon:yes stop_codon:yes gene_type:complete